MINNLLLLVIGFVAGAYLVVQALDSRHYLRSKEERDKHLRELDRENGD